MVLVISLVPPPPPLGWQPLLSLPRTQPLAQPLPQPLALAVPLARCQRVRGDVRGHPRISSARPPPASRNSTPNKSVECSVWCVMRGVWCVVCGCVVCGVWCAVCGAWCVVCGCVVCGVWVGNGGHHYEGSTIQGQYYTRAVLYKVSTIRGQYYTREVFADGAQRSAPGHLNTRV